MSRINPYGRVKRRGEKWRSASRQEVFERADGHCEGCFVAPPTDWAHVAGRRNIVSEPYASSPELTVALCRKCHGEIDSSSDKNKQERLRIEAAKRLHDGWLTWYPELPITIPEDFDGLDRIRLIVRIMQDDIHFDITRR